MARLIRRYGKSGQPIMKSEIEEAQKKSRSGMGAARWLGVSYTTYKKYAKAYGLHEGHLNPQGVGISKGSGKSKSPPLSEILSGKHPTYSINHLKRRLVSSGLMKESCGLCGFSEERVTDYKRPIILTVKDGNRNNLVLSNLVFLCYNHAFLLAGQQADSQLGHKLRLESAEAKESIIGELELRDMPDPELTREIDPVSLEHLEEIELTEEEKQEILKETLEEKDKGWH